MAVRKAKSAAKSKGSSKKASKRGAGSRHARSMQIAELGVALFTELTEWSSTPLDEFDLGDTPPTDYPLFLKLHYLVAAAADDPTNFETYFSDAKSAVNDVSAGFDLTETEFGALKFLFLPSTLSPLAPYWFSAKKFNIW